MIENYIYDTGYMPEQYIMSYQIKDNSDYTKYSKQKKNKKHGVNNNKHLSPALMAHHHYHGANNPYSHGYYSDITGYPMNEHYGIVKDKKKKDKSAGRKHKEDKDSSYYSDTTGYPMNEHYGVVKDKKQREKSAGRQHKEDKDSSYYSDSAGYPMNEHYGIVKDKNQRDKSAGRQHKEDKDSSYLGKFMTLSKKALHKNKAKDNDDIYAIPRPSLVPGESIQRSTILRNMRKSTGQITERRGMVNSKSMSNLHVRGLAKDYTGTRRSSSGSSEEMYESMEHIRSRKTIQSAFKRAQCSKVKKTGHPLFDHLRAKSQEDILSHERSMSPAPLKNSQEHIPQPVWPKADPSSKHAYHYIDDSSDIYSSSNDEVEYPRFQIKHAPDYRKDEINEYDDVYSVPRFADSANRKLYQEMRSPEMRYH